MTQNGFAVLAINWVMQGMRGMDRKELSFRLLLELLVFLTLLPAFELIGFGMVSRVAAASLTAHSFNFLFNGQLWVCVRYCPFYRRDPRAIDRWRDRCFARLAASALLREAVCIGSQGRGAGTRSENSDIDLRLFFGRGLLDWLAVNLLLMRPGLQRFSPSYRSTFTPMTIRIPSTVSIHASP
ncbi:MAG: hypothetical protein R3C97_01765 [Geminicoccaceae bacterium]